MTLAEKLRAAREIKTQEEVNMETGNIDIQQPTEQNTEEDFSLTDYVKNAGLGQRLNLVRTLNDTGYKSSYTTAREKAEREWKTLDEINDRAELTELYNLYAQSTQEAAANKNAEDYFKYQMLTTNIANKIGKKASPITYGQDLLAEVGAGVMNNIANKANAVVGAAINAKDVYDSYDKYHIRALASGFEKPEEREEFSRVEKMREMFPNDVKIAELYDYMKNGNYKGDNDYLEALADYASTRYATALANNWINEHTADEARRLQNLKTREALSKYNGLAQLGLNAVGSVAEQLPDIALGVGVGKALPKSVGENAAKIIASQAGLIPMGITAAGGAFSEALRDGYDFNKSFNYAVARGGIEYLTEVVGGEAVGKMLAGTLTPVTPLRKLIGEGIEKLSLKNKWIKFGVGLLGDVGSEIIEEEFSTLLEPFVREGALGEKITPERMEQLGSEMISSAYETILPTLILGGMNRVSVAQHMKNFTNSAIFSVEMNTQLTNEQKEELKKGIVEAYDNAAHFLTDEESAAKYEEVEKKVLDTLKQTAEKDEQAKKLWNALNEQRKAKASSGQEELYTKQQQTEQLDKYMKTQGGVFNPWWTAQQEEVDAEQEALRKKTEEERIRRGLEKSKKKKLDAGQKELLKQINQGTSKTFDELAQEYGTVNKTNINGQEVEYITVDKSSPDFEYAQQFFYENPEMGENFGNHRTATQDYLNSQPVVYANNTRKGGAMIFKNVDDAKAYFKDAGVKSGTIRSLARSGSYYLTPKEGDWVWRSELSGRIARGADEYKPNYLSDVKNAFKDGIPDRPGYIEGLTGKSFSTIGEFADIMQPAIDPVGETFRYILTKKDGKKETIVAQDARHSAAGATTMAHNNYAENLRYLLHAIEESGADKIYLIHNHPDHSTPSGLTTGRNDVGFTKNFKTFFDAAKSAAAKSNAELGGALVEGIYDYSFFNVSDAGRLVKKSIDQPYDNGYKYEGFVNEPWRTQYVSASNEHSLLRISQEIPTRQGYSKFILLDFDGHPRAFANVSNDFILNNSIEDVNWMIYDLSVENSGMEACIVTDDADVFKKADNDLTVTGGVLSSDMKTSITRDFHHAASSRNIGYTKIDRAIRLTPKKDEFDGGKFMGREKVMKDVEVVDDNSSNVGEIDLEENPKQEPKRGLEATETTEEAPDVYKFATAMEKNKNGIFERKIQDVEEGRTPREQHGLSSKRGMLKTLNEMLGGRLAIGQYNSRGTYGIFKPSSGWVHLKERSNVSTGMHELGHWLNFEKLPNIFNQHPEIIDEVSKLCEKAFGHTYRGAMKEAEGFAEAVRWFVIDPVELAQNYPNVAAVIANELDQMPDTKKYFDKLQKAAHDYIHMTHNERTDSNIVWGDEEEGFVEKMVKAAKNLPSTIEKKFFNRANAATKIDKKLEERYKLKYGEKVYMPSALKVFDNLRRAASTGDSITQVLKTGLYDYKTDKKLCKGLSEVVEPFRITSEEAKELGTTKDAYFNKKLKELARYGFAKRTIELHERGEKEGKVYETGERLQDAERVVDELEQDQAIVQAFSDIQDISNAILDYAVENNVLKPEVAEKIKNQNLFYMPLNRYFEEGRFYGSSSQEGATNNPYKALRGSDRAIANPLVSLVGNWARVLKTVDENAILYNLVKVAKDVGDYGEIFTEVTPLMKYQGSVGLEEFRENLEKQLGVGVVNGLDLDSVFNLFVPLNADPSKLTTSYLDKGVRKWIKFANNDDAKELYQLLSNLNPRQASEVLNAVSYFNNGIRMGATTMNPFFAIGNIMSDEFQAFLYSDGLVIPVAQLFIDAPRLWKAQREYNQNPDTDKKLGKLYRKFVGSGVSLSGKFSLGEKQVKDVAPEIYGATKKSFYGTSNKAAFWDKFKQIMSALPEFSEEMTRFSEFVRVYDKLTKEGVSDADAVKEAGIKAREITQDFSIQGEVMQDFVNKVIPFSSAKVGGLYRFMQEVKKHPTRLSFRMGALIGFTILLSQLRHSSDEAEKYFEEINKQKRFDNFIFPIGEDEPLIIKKPQGTPKYFINFAETMYDIANGYVKKDEIGQAITDWLGMSLKDQMPMLESTDAVPSFVQPFLENSLNMDFYYGSKIVPQEYEKLDPRHQYNQYTSEFSKAVGNIFNWSPMKIDNVVKGVFAGMGSFALDTTDYIVKGIKGEEVLPNKTRSENYLGSKFFADAYRSPESVNEVYDRLEVLEREKAEGRMTDEQQREYDNLSKAKNTFTKITKQINAVRIDPKLSAEQKTEQKRQLQQLKIDVARYYRGDELINPENKKKITVYEYYPAQDTYKKKVNGVNVNVTFTDKQKNEYAVALEQAYKEKLKALKETKEYQNASAAEKIEKEKSLLSNTRTSVNKTQVDKAYNENKGRK